MDIENGKKCVKKNVVTGNRFRSCVLGVMSPARFLCAMPAKQCCSIVVEQTLCRR